MQITAGIVINEPLKHHQLEFEIVHEDKGNVGSIVHMGPM